MGDITRNGLFETSVPVKPIGNFVEYPTIEFVVTRVNAVDLTPGETFPYEAFAVFEAVVPVRSQVTGKLNWLPCAIAPCGRSAGLTLK